MSYLQGKTVVASVSGGKDSAAMCLWLREQGIEHRRVFFDTGWEHPDTYAYLRGPLTEALGPIVELRGPMGMRELVLKKGMFPTRVRRWCTDELKVRPAKKYIDGLQDEGHVVVNAVGVRAAESPARAQLSRWEWSDAFDCEVWRPVLDWTERQVVDVHRRHGLPPNPLYLRGSQRVGCWPCIYARKSEVRAMADADPGFVERMERLEADVASAARERLAARGETLESAGLHPPTWFVRRRGVGPTNDRMWPIREVVEWSKTSRGGRQLELLAPADSERGCMRWGLCDTAGEDE